MVALLPVNRGNLEWYAAFEEVYDDCLKEFMSRIRPNHSENFEALAAGGLLLWDYILVGGKPVGSVWLEKESSEAKTAVLGILIAEESCRGKHAGEEVVRLICKDGADVLGVDSVELNVRPRNVRAIRCYRKCGFEETERFVKPNGVAVVHMKKDL